MIFPFLAVVMEMLRKTRCLSCFVFFTLIICFLVISWKSLRYMYGKPHLTTELIYLCTILILRIVVTIHSSAIQPTSIVFIIGCQTEGFRTFFLVLLATRERSCFSFCFTHVVCDGIKITLVIPNNTEGCKWMPEKQGRSCK